MKKIFFSLLLVVSGFAGFSQTTVDYATYDSNGMAFKKRTDTIITPPYNANYFFNGNKAFQKFDSSVWKALSATSPLSFNNTTGVISSQTASGSQNGYLTSTDWTTFNNKIGITSPVNGDIVYYNSGWQRLGIGTNGQHLKVVSGLPAWVDTTAGGGGGSGWNLTGNAGTTAGTNYSGTSDAVDYVLKANAVEKERIKANGRVFIDSMYLGRSTGTGRLTNVVFGDTSLQQMTTGNYNIAIGNYSMLKDTSGSRNTAVGDSSLRNDASGSDNVAIGWEALNANTTGFQNVAIGNTALGLNTTGTENVAIGYKALTANTTAGGSNANVAIGWKALTANTTGGQNTAVGQNSLASNTTNSYNTSLGWDALVSSTGSRNTSVGAESLISAAGGNWNIALGEGAGDKITTGSQNIWIGSDVTTSQGLSTGSYNTIIGTAIVGLSSSLSNTVIIGDGQGNQRFYSNSSKQAGLNYTSPSATLQLAPGSTAAGTAPLKLTYFNLATTAASGTGAVATLTFAAQAQPPFAVGSTINVSGVTPSGYNGTNQTVTACTTTTVSYSNATSGSQTVAGTVQAGTLLTTPESGAIETDGTRPYFTGKDGIRGMIPLTFTGTAAPTTTPSSIGDHYVDTTNKKEYVATGTSSSSDWTILN